MNYAFKHFEQLEVVPIFTAVAMIMNQVIGGVAMDEFSSYSGSDFVHFCTGTSICVLGMMLQLWFDSRHYERERAEEYETFVAPEPSKSRHHSTGKIEAVPRMSLQHRRWSNPASFGSVI